MRLIDANALYERTAEWEAQALHMVEVTMNDEDKTKWRKWSAVLAERSAFKHDIADAPTIEPEQQWIPVSETVDVPEHEVLACDKYGTELIGFICEKDEQWMCESDECIIYDVVAWMPLPEPYKGETDGES